MVGDRDRYRSTLLSTPFHIPLRVRHTDSDVLCSSLCKSLIRKLLIKDELRRIGSRAGASDVKSHPFFRYTQWALLRHMKPPMIPHAGRAIDTVNFRNVKESNSSMDLGQTTNGTKSTSSSAPGRPVNGASSSTVLEGTKVKSTGSGGMVIPTNGLKGVPLDSGEKTPMGELDTVDPFEEFNSVTLHHDGDHNSSDGGGR